MANAVSNIDMIAAEACASLYDALTITRMTARDKTSDFMQRPNGYALGDTIKINTRPDYEAKEFTGSVSPQDIRESKRSMSIEKFFDISVEIGAKEKVLDHGSFSEEVVNPAMIRLAEKVDQYVGTKLIRGAGLYSSASLFQSPGDVAQARKAATLQQLDPAGRFCLTNLDLEASILGQDWFNQSQTRGAAGEHTLLTGYMGHAMGMDFTSSINFPDSTGTWGNGAGVTKASPSGDENKIGATVLTLNAGSTGTFEVGDHIKVAGLRRPLIVAAQATAGATSITLRDPITEIVPASAAVTVVGSGAAFDIQGAIFDGRSMAVAMPLLDAAEDKPSAVMSFEGVSVRVVYGYDMQTKKTMMSFDLLVGAEAYDPRRITLLSAQ